MLKRGFKQMLDEANAVIESASVQDLTYLMEDPEAMLVDVRETVEHDSNGAVPGSLHMPRGMLEFKADPDSPVYDNEFSPEDLLIPYCGTGGRSPLSAKTLPNMDYQNVSSPAGGRTAWCAALK